jgi:hypothetical protein
MLEELQILKLVCQKLEDANIRYMLTGSVAANQYTVSRMTRDIDIVLEVSKSDTEKIFNAFRNDFYVERDAIAQAIEHREMFNIIHNDLMIKVDFIMKKNSNYQELGFARKVRMLIHDFSVWIISLEDLIISKLDWAKESFSEMQLKDVRNLLLNQNIDHDYIDEWVTKLSLNDVYQKVKSL